MELLRMAKRGPNKSLIGCSVVPTISCSRSQANCLGDMLPPVIDIYLGTAEQAFERFKITMSVEEAEELVSRLTASLTCSGIIQEYKKEKANGG
jgi:hypothetical protein